MKPKVWHIIVITAGLLVGFGSIAYTLAGSGSPVNSVIHCVDVETGDLYRINIKSTPVILPARHPSTGRICLVRVHQEEKGEWVVSPRDLSSMDALDPDVKNAVVDEESGALKGGTKKPITYSPKKP